MALRDPNAYTTPPPDGAAATHGPRPADQDAPITGTVTTLTAEDLTSLGRMGASATTAFISLHADRDAAKAAAEIHYGGPIEWRPHGADPFGPETSGDMRHVMYTIAEAAVLGTPTRPETEDEAAARTRAEEVRQTLIDSGVAPEVINRVMTDMGRPATTAPAVPEPDGAEPADEGLFVLKVNESVDGRGPTRTRGYFTDPALAVEAAAAFGTDMGGRPHGELFRIDNVNEGIPTRYDETTGEPYTDRHQMFPTLTPIHPAG